jgi:DNA polymerase/3'-5' exonuclease PolX
MSTGEIKYSLADALERAEWICDLLAHHCTRIEIAGSIRRKKPEVGDIEIVCIPKPYQTGLFEDGFAAVVNQWKKVKGEPEYGKMKYTQRILPSGIKLDLFVAHPDNFGLLMGIRTGSAEFSKKILADGWVKAGYNGVNGFLVKRDTGIQVEVREEIDLFKMIGIDYVEPENREL